jgi:hypothetical protein
MVNLNLPCYKTTKLFLLLRGTGLKSNIGSEIMKIEIPFEDLINADNTNKIINQRLREAGFHYQSELITYKDVAKMCSVYEWDN